MKAQLILLVENGFGGRSIGLEPRDKRGKKLGE
jgi:hypothetical protein